MFCSAGWNAAASRRSSSCRRAPRRRLKALGLPESIAVEHFNNIEGLDGYKNVRLLIVVGRTMPTPFEVENDAAAISGIEPTLAKTTDRFKWFDQVALNITMKDNSTGPTVKCDRHPDPLAEAVRHQICEAQLVQAVGRARAVNRTEANPVDIDVLADVTLPTIPADTVLEWNEAAPSKIVEMAVEGVILTSPTDMVAIWPEVWGSVDSAQRSMKGFAAQLSGFEEKAEPQKPYKKSYYEGFCGSASYQLPGNGQRPRKVHFNPVVLPDIRSWLEERLGPLAGFELTGEPEQSRPEQQPETPRLGVFIRRGNDAAETLIEVATVNGWPIETRVAVTKVMRPRSKPEPFALGAARPCALR